MEYNELAGIWNSADTQLATSVRVNRQLVKEAAFTKIRSGLFEIKWTAVAELVACFLWSWFLVVFIVNHFYEYKFSLPAFVLVSLSLYSFMLSIDKLKTYFSINPGLPVLETQLKMECLKKLELKSLQSLYVIIPLFSAPFAIVMAKAWLNLDLYSFSIFGKALLYYTLGSIVVTAVIVFVLKKIPGNKDKQLKESIAFLNELKEFDEAGE